MDRLTSILAVLLKEGLEKEKSHEYPLESYHAQRALRSSQSRHQVLSDWHWPPSDQARHLSCWLQQDYAEVQVRLQPNLNEVNAKMERTMSVLKLVLYPNTERASLIFPKKINKEAYSFNRKKEAKGKEKTLINRLSAIVGIDTVRIGGEEVSLEIRPATNPHEWFPAALTAASKFVGEELKVVLEDERWVEWPESGGGEDDWLPRKDGIRMSPGAAKLGVPYTPFTIE